MERSETGDIPEIIKLISVYAGANIPISRAIVDKAMKEHPEYFREQGSSKRPTKRVRK